MALSNHKITDQQISTHGVTAAADKLTGTPAENKALFDRLVKEAVKNEMNALIDALAGQGGAGEIGAVALDGETVSNIQTVIGAIKTLIDACETQAAANAALALKEDKTVTAQHYKAVSFNANDGKLTFTRENGSFTVIDTALEKVATNFSYDSGSQSLVLTLADGSTQNVSLSAFVTTNEYSDSETIEFSTDGTNVTATIKSGSITDTMLSSALKTLLEGYVTSAAASASNALTAQLAAETAKNAAAVSASEAAEKAESILGMTVEAHSNGQATPTVSSVLDESGHVHLSFGLQRGATGDTGAAGADGNGFYGFSLDDDGHLVVTAENAELAADFAIDSDGHLIHTVDGVSVDLGAVRFADGDGVSY